jgi:phytoene desaturase
MQPPKKIIVIGTGFGGLSAAARLAARGHQVTLFEKRDQLGGRAYQYQVNGFSFDGGPTVITAPYMFDEIWALAGRRRGDYFDLLPLDPFYRIIEAGGRSFDYYRDPEQTAAEIGKISPADQEGYRRFVAATQKIFAAFHPSTETPFLTFQSMLAIMPQMLQLQAFRSMYNYASRFVADEFVRRISSFHPLLVGGNPFDTPSIFSLIIQFERE